MSLPRQIASRIITHESYEGRGFTDVNSLARMRLTKPDTINPAITHLMGRDDKRFPLTFLTEGQKGGRRKIAINSIEYKFPVMGRLKQSDQLVRVEGISLSDTNIGQGGTPVWMVFKTDWIKMHHTIYSPNGIGCRVQGKGQRVSGGFLYKTVLIWRDNSEVIPGGELKSNTKWSMTGGASVSASDSKGNESNVQGPGELKNQISILRKSYHIAGNVANKVTEFQFDTAKGRTSYWMPFEEYQHDIQFKQACEENLWWSKYNRDSNGVVTTIDDETGLPIPMAAGVDDQIPNRDTYGELTAKKLGRTVSDVMYGATDTGSMNIVLFTGIGGMEEFDQAIKRDIQGNSSSVWTTLLSGAAADKFITGAPGSHNLAFGAYFNQYKHVDGHVVTVKHLNLLDFGGRADNSPEHPITGKPLSSYEMYFIDMSQYDGENNLKMVCEKGRSLIRGVEQGMALLKGNSYGDYKGNSKELNLATDQDRTSVHFMKTLGVSMFRNTHCFKLECNLS